MTKKSSLQVGLQFGILILSLGSVASCIAPPATQSFQTTKEPSALSSPIHNASVTAPIIHTASNTHLPSATYTPKPTNTPTPALSATNNPDVSSYQLRTWTEQDGAKWADEAAQVSMAGIAEYANPVVAFEVEQLLRFPESKDWTDNAWQVVRANPKIDHLPGMPPGQTAFNRMVENFLNQPGAKVDDFLASPDSLPFYVTGSLTIPNLFGDGQEAIIFKAESADTSHCATFGLRKAGALYRVETISNWETCAFVAFSAYFTLEALGDTNGNSLPELGLLVEAGHSGTPPTQGESLQWYEWDESAQNFDTQDFRIFGQTCGEFDQELGGDGPCVGKYIFQNRTLITREYWFTQPGCPDMEIQQIYRWNGKEYALNRKRILPAPEGPAECRLAWADEMIRLYGSGRTNDEAINIVAEMVESWSDETNLWGPAGKDYFQLRLGIWQDLRGEGHVAENLLQSLAANPSNPQYTFASQIALIYLKNRAQQGLFKACFAAENAWNDSLQFGFATPFSFDELRDKWGFVNHRWPYFLGGGAHAESLCPFQDGLTIGIRKLQFSTAAELQQWLENAGLPIQSIETGDFNEDGQADYLVAVKLPEKSFMDQSIWLFAQTSNGTVVSMLDRSGFIDSEEIPSISLSWEQYHFTEIPFPVCIVQHGSDLIAFTLDSDEQIEILFEERNLKSFTQTGDGFSVVSTDWNKSTQVSNYSWDKLTNKFSEQVAGYDFASVEHTIEQDLFVYQNYPAAIAQIERFLIEAPSEPRQIVLQSQDSVTYAPDWYHPYLRYLLGIAYELNGQSEQAIEAYFLLWQSYPDHVFGQAAKDKLMLRQP